MRWLSRGHAQESAFAASDGQVLAFRVSQEMPQDRVHLLARATFGYRADLGHENGAWIVTRRPFSDAAARVRFEKHRRRTQQRQAHALASSRTLSQLGGGL